MCTRTGTFAALVLAKMKLFSEPEAMTERGFVNSSNSLDPVVSFTPVFLTKVVEIIVEIRRSRDGLVETPDQLQFILKVLALDVIRMQRP